MKNVISYFYLEIQRLLKELETIPDQKETIPILIDCVKKELRKYNEDEWQEVVSPEKTVMSNYMEHSFFLSTIEEKLILFLIVSWNKSRIHNYNSIIISIIIESLAWAKIDPNEYQFYVDLLLDPDTYSELKEIDTYNIKFIISNLVNTIRLYKDDNKDELHAYILSKLYKINNKNYSPIFQNDFSSENIYQILKEKMEQKNKKAFAFTPQDFHTLQTILTIEQTDEFTIQIKKLEETYSTNETLLIRQILHFLSTLKKPNGNLHLIRTNNQTKI